MTKQVINLEYGWSFVEGLGYIDINGNVRTEEDYADYVVRRKKYDKSWENCNIDDLIDIKSKADCIIEEKKIEKDAISGIEKVFYRAVVFNYDSFTELQFRDNFDGTTIARFRNIEFEDLGYVLNRMNASFDEKLNFIVCALSLDLNVDRLFEGYHIIDFVLNNVLYRLVYSRERESIRVKEIRKIIRDVEVKRDDKVEKEIERKKRELLGF